MYAKRISTRHGGKTVDKAFFEEVSNMEFLEYYRIFKQNVKGCCKLMKIKKIQSSAFKPQ